MKYANGKERTTHSNVLSKGMGFETALNLSNDYYRAHNIAVVYKKPTPVNIVRVEYPNRKKSKIVEAYYKLPSTTDYNGIYKGFYIDFEAKETHTKYFNLSNIYEHQIEHLKKIHEHKGVAFILVCFSVHKKVYAIHILDLLKCYKDKERKSIKIEEFDTLGFLIEFGYNPVIDYIKVLDKYIKQFF